MNKKIIYTLSIVIFVILLIPFYVNFFNLRYSNVFEEIYHDEYHHATTSFLRTNSTLNKIPDIEENRTRGLFYGHISEQYRLEVLPPEIESISYGFNFPDDKLENGDMSINFRFKLSNEEMIGIYYIYKHNSDKLV